MKIKTFLLTVLFGCIQTLYAHAQSVNTDKKYYVINSYDGGGTAWIVDYPEPPAYDNSGHYAFYNWDYEWSGAVTGWTRDTYVSIDATSATKSTSEGDRKAKVKLRPSYKDICTGEIVYGGYIDVTDASFTVAEIESTARATGDNLDPGREHIGLSEEIHLKVMPELVAVRWSNSNHGTIEGEGMNSGGGLYTASRDEETDTVTATFDSEESGSITFDTVAPSGMDVSGTITNIPLGVPGNSRVGAKSIIPVRILPDNVSFYNLPMEECVTTEDTASTWPNGDANQGVVGDFPFGVTYSNTSRDTNSSGGPNDIGKLINGNAEMVAYDCIWKTPLQYAAQGDMATFFEDDLHIFQYSAQGSCKIKQIVTNTNEGSSQGPYR